MDNSTQYFQHDTVAAAAGTPTNEDGSVVMEQLSTG